jgi:two-component system, OmpR family, response regulator
MDTAAAVRFPSAGTTLRVLVAEDEPAAAAALAEILRQEGYEAVVAHNGLEALELAVRESPDVALLDIGLPGLDGYRLAERLYARAGARRPLLVAVTGRGAALDRACSAAAGIDLHLVKPIDPAQLVRLLRRFSDTVRP